MSDWRLSQATVDFRNEERRAAMSAYDYPPFNPEPLDEDCDWNTAGITSTDEEDPLADDPLDDELGPDDAQDAT